MPTPGFLCPDFKSSKFDDNLSSTALACEKLVKTYKLGYMYCLHFTSQQLIKVYCSPVGYLKHDFVITEKIFI